ncbi:hypothetical protein BH23PAT1_BH23PAT1_4010 [soil metagenome]
MPDDNAVSTKLEGFPPELEIRLTNFLDAQYPDFYVDRRTGKGIQTVAGLLGASAVTVASLDKIATEQSPGNLHGPDATRTESIDRMQSAVTDITATLAHEPDEVIVCRESEYRSACTTAESFNVSTEDGALRFAKAEIDVNLDLKPKEKSALSTGLPEPTKEARTEKFDQVLADSFDEQVEAHVATIPDDPLETTNTWTGEAAIAGSALLLFALGIKHYTLWRNHKLQAKLNITEREVRSYSDSWPGSERRIIKATGMDEYNRWHARLQKGGKPAKRRAFARVQKAATMAETTNKQAS